MKNRILYLVLLCAIGKGNAQQNIGDEVDSLVNRIAKSNDIKGLAIGIVFDNQTVFSKGYGYLKKDSNQREIDSTTPMLSASISKTFVATAILQLQEKGLLNISDSIVKYLPQFRMRGDDYKVITIRQLLNHTSGLSEGSNYSWDKKKNKGKDIENFVLSLKKKSLLFIPGERFGYSNTGYVILGYFIAEITGQPFSEYIENEILKKWAMIPPNFQVQ